MSTENNIGGKDNDLFWHTLNYRTAETLQAERAWLEIVACVNRLVEAERLACADKLELRLRQFCERTGMIYENQKHHTLYQVIEELRSSGKKISS